MSLLLSQTEIEKNIFEVVINFSNLQIDKKEIESSLGYPEDMIPNHFSELIDEIISELPDKCKIKAGYCLAEINKQKEKKDGLTIADKFFNMDRLVTAQIKKSELAALFVCTIGNVMENWSRQLLTNGDPATAFLVDTVASITVESVTDLLHDFIGDEMKKRNLNITNRYSPGYCNWPVSEQQLLFSFFPQNFCGIILTDSSLMIPIKSVSGVIGIGANVKRKDYVCDQCGMKDCTYRAVRSRLKSI